MNVSDIFSGKTRQRGQSTLQVILVLLAFFNSIQSHAHPRAPDGNKGDATFNAVKELGQEGTEPELANALAAKSNEYQATFYSWEGRIRCTSSLIGPRVLLTAAHCVGNSKNASIALNGTTYSGPCTHHPKYAKGDVSADYALCVLDKPVPEVPYELINTDSSKIKIGRTLLLSGFGCTSLDGTGPSDMVYRIGKAKIVNLPGTVGGEANTIITKSELSAPALLCKGDSGGPAFHEGGVPGYRVIVSVNSRTWAERKLSYLSSLTTTEAMKWIERWSQEDPVRRICGLSTPPPTGCR